MTRRSSLPSSDVATRVGELRRELESGEPAARHTDLRAWLSSS
jgi:hypothetical protein